MHAISNRSLLFRSVLSCCNTKYILLFYKKTCLLIVSMFALDIKQVRLVDNGISKYLWAFRCDLVVNCGEKLYELLPDIETKIKKPIL